MKVETEKKVYPVMLDDAAVGKMRQLHGFYSLRSAGLSDVEVLYRMFEPTMTDGAVFLHGNGVVIPFAEFELFKTTVETASYLFAEGNSDGSVSVGGFFREIAHYIDKKPRAGRSKKNKNERDVGPSIGTNENAIYEMIVEGYRELFGRMKFLKLVDDAKLNTLCGMCVALWRFAKEAGATSYSAARPKHGEPVRVSVEFPSLKITEHELAYLEQLFPHVDYIFFQSGYRGTLVMNVFLVNLWSDEGEGRSYELGK